MTEFLRRLVLSRARRPKAPAPAEDERAGALKQNMPLVPAGTIAGRALVTVIAIMTFLASLAAGAGILVSDASNGWTESIAREMTIQVKPASGRDTEADVTEAARIAGATTGIASVHVISRAESERLLEPWLGTGLDLGELPVPRLIVLNLAPGARIDVPGLRSQLTARVPTAMVDDHRLWLERLATMAHTLVVVVAVVFVLVLVAMALAITFATHGAMAGNREIVAVLHFVGAADTFIAREFQRHFLRLGLRGGALGGGAAILAFALSAWLSRWFMAGAGSDQVEALFGTFALGLRGYVAIACIALGVAVLTGIMSRTIVFRHLRSLG
jgi:cell division transport system permease protein